MKKVVLIFVKIKDMKKLSKLRLNTLNESLEEKEMASLKGGERGRCCTCTCSGPSGTNSNFTANYKLGTYGGYSSGYFPCYFYY
jgi:natural product precursor